MNIHCDISVKPARNEDIGVGNLRGFINRSFLLSEITIADSYAESEMGFALGVHAQKDGSALVEVKYRVIEYAKPLGPGVSWKNIPEKVWRKFFDMHRTTMETKTTSDLKCFKLCRTLENGFATLPDGKTPCFKIELDDCKNPSVKQVLCCPIVKFLEVWQFKFPVFLKYWDKISTMKDLKDLVDAIDRISEVAYSIKTNTLKARKHDAICELKKYEMRLAELEDKLSKVYEDAADAMNELVDKFGIELDLDDHCRGNVE